MGHPRLLLESEGSAPATGQLGYCHGLEFERKAKSLKLKAQSGKLRAESRYPSTNFICQRLTTTPIDRGNLSPVLSGKTLRFSNPKEDRIEMYHTKKGAMNALRIPK